MNQTSEHSHDVYKTNKKLRMSRLQITYGAAGTVVQVAIDFERQPRGNQRWMNELDGRMDVKCDDSFVVRLLCDDEIKKGKDGRKAKGAGKGISAQITSNRPSSPVTLTHYTTLPASSHDDESEELRRRRGLRAENSRVGPTKGTSPRNRNKCPRLRLQDV